MNLRESTKERDSTEFCHEFWQNEMRNDSENLVYIFILADNE